MRAELRDSLENLFADSTVRKTPARSLELHTARGTVPSVHLLLEGLTPGRTVGLSVRCNGRPVREARWFRLLDVPVEENTGLVGFTCGSPTLNVVPYSDVANCGNPHVIRAAPFRTYDAMAPSAGREEALAPTMAFRLHLPVKANAAPGLRRYELSVEHNGAVQALELTLRVHRAVVPPIGAATLPYTNWFSFENIAKRHGLTLWTEPYWRMLKSYAELMAHGRQNAFWVPLHVIFTVGPQGPVLERERLRRIVRVFTAAGLHWIEGGHLANRTGGEWEAKTFDTALGTLRATEPAGHAALVSLCRQLMDAIREHGWESRWIQHVTDEPIPANAIDYRILVGIVHKYMPGMPILDATQDPKLVGSVDIWCPQVHEYQRDLAEYEAQRALGDRVWCYTCCFPGGPWLNRLLDEELLRPALIGWGIARYNLDGFLHWGLNHYREDQDPFQQSVLPNHAGGKNSLPPGDTHIVYPGADGPWSSLRLESHREGFEDYELLRQLRARNPKRAAAITAKALTRFDRYVRSPGAFRRARAALLEALDHE